jgi:hypothetical protein
VQLYLEELRKSDRTTTSLLNHEGGHLRRDWEAKNSIIVTWQISFDHICETRPSAADLLSLMSLLTGKEFPRLYFEVEASREICGKTRKRGMMITLSKIVMKMTHHNLA